MSQNNTSLQQRYEEMEPMEFPYRVNSETEMNTFSQDCSCGNTITDLRASLGHIGNSDLLYILGKCPSCGNIEDTYIKLQDGKVFILADGTWVNIQESRIRSFLGNLKKQFQRLWYKKTM